jgi:hypothetical protein
MENLGKPLKSKALTVPKSVRLHTGSWSNRKNTEKKRLESRNMGFQRSIMVQRVGTVTSGPQKVGAAE